MNSNEDPTGMNNCVYPRNINSMKVNNILGLVNMYIHSMYKKIKSTNKYVGGGGGGERLIICSPETNRETFMRFRKRCHTKLKTIHLLIKYYI